LQHGVSQDPSAALFLLGGARFPSNHHSFAGLSIGRKYAKTHDLTAIAPLRLDPIFGWGGSRCASGRSHFRRLPRRAADGAQETSGKKSAPLQSAAKRA